MLRCAALCCGVPSCAVLALVFDLGCFGLLHPAVLFAVLQVLSGHICYDQQQQQHVAAVYDARAYLHEHVYQHWQAKAAQLVIADALAAAEPVLQLKDKVNE